MAAGAVTAYARKRAARTAEAPGTEVAGHDAAAAAVLDLQRRAGNAAVTALLAPPEPAVQRVRSAAATGGKRKATKAAASSGRGMKKKKRRVPPAPRLVASETSREANDCGDFSLVRHWHVLHPGRRGCIVQEVTRTFAVERFDGAAWSGVAGAVLDAYVAPTGSTVNATELRYWEAWAVGANGAVTFGDAFGLCPITHDLGKRRNTSRGTYTIAGTARFYPRLTLASLRTAGFSTTAVRSANGLLATAVAPTLPASAGNGVTCTATVTWDSTNSAAGAKSVLTVT